MVVQRSADIEIAAVLVQALKTGWDGYQFGKVIGVGHGYGRYGSCVCNIFTPFIFPIAHNFSAWPRNMLISWMEWSSCRVRQMLLHC